MHKALFGLITVGALIAVGVMFCNRPMQSSVQNISADRTPVAGVVNPSCCSEIPTRATANTQPINLDINTACMRRSYVADTSHDQCPATSAVAAGAKCTGACSEGKGECCASGTAECSAKSESCCAGASGECCSKDATVSTASDSCCSDEADEKEASAEGEVAVAVALPCGCQHECSCDHAKDKSAESNPK